MSDDSTPKDAAGAGDVPADPHQVFIDLLEESGFFKQVGALEQNLQTIAGELKAFAEGTASRMAEIENLAAHVLAIESVLAAMLARYPVDADVIAAEVKDRTAAMSGDAGGSPTVRALALNILDKAANEGGD